MEPPPPTPRPSPWAATSAWALNSFFYDYGSKAFSVAHGFSLGANSFFDDFGTMVVGGNFDAGTGSPINIDTVGGVFDAASGSTVTTNTAAWEVLAGGSVDVAAGAAFTVASGGALTVDGGGNVSDQGSLMAAGTLASSLHSTIVVDDSGQLSTQGTGQLNVQGILLTWNNPAASITHGIPLSAAQLDATANVPGTFTYTLADGVTPALGALLPVGAGQTVEVTFTPFDAADYSSASAQVSANVIAGPNTPLLAAPPGSATYTGLPQGYPASAVVVSGVNGLSNSAGTLSFTYNGLATVPTTAGTYTVVATFTPTDSTDYTAGSTTTTWTISPATPTVHAPSATTTYTGAPQGYPASAVVVSGVNGLSNSAGMLSFTYNGSATVPTTAGTYTVVATFTPSDSADYNAGSATTTWTISLAMPTVHAPARPPRTPAHRKDIRRAPSWCPASMASATARAPWSFTYNGSATVPTTAGTYTVVATFTPSDSADYNAGSATTTWTISPAMPTVHAPARPRRTPARHKHIRRMPSWCPASMASAAAMAR